MLQSGAGRSVGADEEDQEENEQLKKTTLEQMNDDAVEERQEKFGATVECSKSNWMRKRYMGLLIRDCWMVEP